MTGSWIYKVRPYQYDVLLLSFIPGSFLLSNRGMWFAAFVRRSLPLLSSVEGNVPVFFLPPSVFLFTLSFLFYFIPQFTYLVKFLLFTADGRKNTSIEEAIEEAISSNPHGPSKFRSTSRITPVAYLDLCRASKHIGAPKH